MTDFDKGPGRTGGRETAHKAEETVRPKRKASARYSKPKAFAIGRKAFASISAVEGIKLSKARDLDELDNASPDERRRVLARKYGKA